MFLVKSNVKNKLKSIYIKGFSRSGKTFMFSVCNN